MFVGLLGRWLAESQRTARPGRPAFGGFDGQTTPAAVGFFLCRLFVDSSWEL